MTRQGEVAIVEKNIPVTAEIALPSAMFKASQW